MKQKILLILGLLLCVAFVSAQGQKVRVYGYVIDESNRGIEDANVHFDGTNIRTSTNRNGYYDLYINIKDSAVVVYSHVGYQTIKHTLTKGKQVVQISVVLPVKSKELKALDVTVNRRSTSNMQTIDPDKLRLMPNANGSFESLLINFTGVTTNNELSSQYNVRGGNFDENIVYVNGIEIYRPLLIRAGQQEGLSFINSDMVGNVKFSSGGFNAEYGDKMSSVLDVQYKKPTTFESSAMVSLLGASLYVGSASKRFTQMQGIRYKTSKYLLGTLDTKGSYQPDFVDYQTYMTYRFSPKWQLSFLGNFSRNNYVFVPDSQSTAFGTYNQAEKLTIYFDGKEKDLFQTSFGALSLSFQPQTSLRLQLTASAFHTNEWETYDITGQYILGELKLGSDGTAQNGDQLGVGTYHQHARNRLNATVANLEHTGEWIKSGNDVKWGINLQREMIDDRMNEWEWRDSAGYSMPYNYDKVIQLYYNLKSNQTLDSWRTAVFLQDTYRWDTNDALYSITAGVRSSYWSVNKQFLLSPRASISILPHWDRDFNFRFATGIYYQPPFYKELRDTVTDALGNVTVNLNRNLKAQQSIHFVLGGDYFFRMLGRPFKFTTEAYLKLLNQVTSYTVDNVRILYSGQNDAKGYTTGIDFKLFGELVPGTDSWINLSLMQSKEDVLNDSYVDANGNTVYPGWFSRPNEARYTLSAMFTDYLPNNPKYKLYLKTVFSDGLPIGPPHSPYYMSDRFRLRDYKRIDIGVSRVLVNGTDKIMNSKRMKHFSNIWLNFEIFNLFDFKNENSIYWVSDVYGYQHGSPNYLTGRQFNLKLIFDFK